MLVAMNMFSSNARVGSLDKIHMDGHPQYHIDTTDWPVAVVPGPWLTLETQLKWFLTNTRPLEETPLRILSIGWGSHYTNQNIPYGQSSAKLPVIMSSCLLSFIFNVTADGQTNEQHQVLQVCFADNKLKFQINGIIQVKKNVWWNFPNISTSWILARHGAEELTPGCQRATAPLTLTMVTHEADGRVTLIVSDDHE